MEDDILKSLLEYGEDELCLDFMGYYKIFLDQDLLLYSLQHGNDIFVKKSLKAGAFDKQIFKDDEVVQEIIDGISRGSSTIIGLNTLVLTDISVW